MRRVYKLDAPGGSVRANARRYLDLQPEGSRVVFEPERKTRDQEALYHALIADAAEHRMHMGRKWDVESWKRLLVDAFARIKAGEGEPIQGHGMIVPNLDGTGFVQLGIQTRNFSKELASEFIEYLHAWLEETEDQA